MYDGVEVVQVMAVSKNNCIGKNNTIPWRCRADMKHFANTTKGTVCIMGRKTFESIDPPLKNRKVIVVSRKGISSCKHLEILSDGDYFLADSIEDALYLAKHLSLMTPIHVIGGKQIYKATLDVTDKLILSEINTYVEEGDTFFDWELPDTIKMDVVHFEED